MPRLHDAVVAGNIEKVEDYLKEGDNINENVGMTPLHLAIRYGNHAMFELLIKEGALLNIKCGRANLTPLELALSTGNHHIASQLKELGATIDCEALRPFLSRADQDKYETCALEEMEYVFSECEAQGKFTAEGLQTPSSKALLFKLFKEASRPINEHPVSGTIGSEEQYVCLPQ